MNYKLKPEYSHIKSKQFLAWVPSLEDSGYGDLLFESQDPKQEKQNLINIHKNAIKQSGCKLYQRVTFPWDCDVKIKGTVEQIVEFFSLLHGEFGAGFAFEAGEVIEDCIFYESGSWGMKEEHFPFKMCEEEV